MRTAVLWVVLHAVVALASAQAGFAPASESLLGAVVIAIYLLAVILIALRVEMGRRSELVFLANLGFSFLDVSLVVAAVCASLEITLSLALA